MNEEDDIYCEVSKWSRYTNDDGEHVLDIAFITTEGKDSKHTIVDNDKEHLDHAEKELITMFTETKGFHEAYKAGKH